MMKVVPNRYSCIFVRSYLASHFILCDASIFQLIRQQRNGLSSALTEMSKEYHQYQCTAGTPGIGSHGGWCTYEGHMTEKVMALALADVFAGDTVASFGDGLGEYKKIVDRTGKVTLYDSYDGAPFCENKTNGVTKYLDLTIPVYGLKMYDWILCLEVGEHVPKIHEETLLDNIARHAGKGIVLSWAVPNQPGRGHINNQPIEYIINQFDKRGFEHDEDSSISLRKKSRDGNLKRNTNIFRRKSGHEADILMV